MKKSYLKNLIRQIIKESVNQNQPSRSDLDAGLMKAVNVEESNYLDKNLLKAELVSKKLFKNDFIDVTEFSDLGGSLWYKINTKKGPRIIKKSKSDWFLVDKKSDLNEPAKLIPIKEMVGVDGKYQDDMESGVAVKRLHGLNEESEEQLKEMSSSGGAGAYATPFAFSKKKEGSSRAIASAKKYGTVVKSISEKKK